MRESYLLINGYLRENYEDYEDNEEFKEDASKRIIELCNKFYYIKIHHRY